MAFPMIFRVFGWPCLAPKRNHKKKLTWKILFSWVLRKLLVSGPNQLVINAGFKSEFGVMVWGAQVPEELIPRTSGQAPSMLYTSFFRRPCETMPDNILHLFSPSGTFCLNYWYVKMFYWIYKICRPLHYVFFYFTQYLHTFSEMGL